MDEDPGNPGFRGGGPMRNTGIEFPDNPSDKVRPYKILAAASLVVPLALFALTAWQDYRIEFQATGQEVVHTAEIFQQHAINVFQTHQLVAERVNDRLLGMTWQEIERSGEVRTYLRKMCGAYPQVMSIWVADASGVIRNASRQLPPSPVRVDDRDYFRALREADTGLFIGEIITGHVTKTQVFNVALRRTGAPGAFDGVVVITVAPTYFRDFWVRTAGASDIGVALVRSDGSILARAPQLDPNVLSISPGGDTALAIRRKEQGAYIGVAVTDARKRLYAIRKTGDYPVYLVYGVGMDVIWREWRKSVVFYAGIFGAATAGLLFLSLVALKRTREVHHAVNLWRDLAVRLEKSAAELETTSRRLQLATDSGHLGVWDWDIKGNAMVWDDRMLELYGLTREAFPGGVEAWENGLHPDDRETAVSECQAALRGEKEFDTDFRVVHPDGAVKHIKADGLVIKDADGNALRMIGINRDVTGQKRAEEELKVYRQGLEALVEQRAEALMTANKQLLEANAYNRRLIETNFDVLVVMNTSGKITDLNQAAENATGYSRDHLLGKDISDCFTEPPRARAAIEQAFGKGSVHGLELEIRHRNGTVTPVLFAASVYRDDSGNVLGILASSRDIKERKLSEERMRHAQKLESLGVLAGGIAHDFNNLLMGVMGHADLALTKLPPVSPVREHLEEVEKASLRAADLCRQMLAYSGKGRFVLESLDVGEVVKEMADMLGMSISKKAILQYRFAPDLPPIEADASQIRQVVMNLIINASEAIGDHPGVISLVTGSMECDSAYLRAIGAAEELSEGRYVFLEVTDSGCGMDKTTKTKIFDPFYTTKFTGRGLGLAAVQGIVRGHRGAIKVYSEKGKGSTFKVLFPASGAVTAFSSPPALPTEGWKGTGTVLLVDDEEMVLRVGAGMLESLGFRVLTARDGQEALEAFSAHRDEIRCVILDLTMPRIGGEEAFRSIRRLDPAARVILTSGYNEQTVTQGVVGEGLAGFLQKPYKMDNLAATLRKVLEG
jgi:two-component system cell cycle sensor histidine kinase/response regulator CckA